ncbi:MAG: exo-alpha-sialidase [Lachnospiraceae bacterium]|nr:exo-alpha-sialidase [Lachnospiraceae bacterium]
MLQKPSRLTALLFLGCLVALVALWLVFSSSGSQAWNQPVPLEDPAPDSPAASDAADISSRQQAALISPQALELTNEMRARYGSDITLEDCQGTLYTFQKKITRPIEGTFFFQAEPSVDPHGESADNYQAELFYFLGSSFVCSGNLSIQWEETGSGTSRQYTPIFDSYGRSAYMLEVFCGNVCDFVEYCMKNSDFSRNNELLSQIRVEYGGQQASYSGFRLDSYERVDFYNALYTFMDDFTLQAHAELTEIWSTQKESDQSPEDTAATIEPEVLEAWLRLEADCLFLTSQGMEYRMVGVDRAAGSSYYVLLGTRDQGRTCSFLNTDPYNGSGGAAKWLTFLDESLGFSCLAYSGGSYGSLYRTQDGGRTFQEIEYPSAKISLSDGSFYNPFVMPEQVYEEDGQLYLVAGQGPEGDYHGEDGRCSGLYTSLDAGETWTYVGEIPAGDTKR